MVILEIVKLQAETLKEQLWDYIEVAGLTIEQEQTLCELMNNLLDELDNATPKTKEKRYEQALRKLADTSPIAREALGL